LDFFTERNKGNEESRGEDPDFVTKGGEDKEGAVSNAAKLQTSLSSRCSVRLSPMHRLYEKADKLSSEVIVFVE